MMHDLFIRFFVFAFIIIKCVHCQQDVGTTCTDNSGAIGVCRLISNCSSAISAIKNNKIYPKTCGFEGKHPIVCCVGNDLKPPSTSPSSFSSTLHVGDKSRAKCKEYEQYGYEHRSPEDAPFSVCNDEIPLIVDPFDKVLIKEFPHMALIGFSDDENKTQWLCGGSLISDQFVLTAAHCLNHRAYGEPTRVRIGDIDIESDDDGAEPQDFTIIEKFTHPDYKTPSVYNDIALLKLNVKARLNSYVRPACLETTPTVNVTDKLLAITWEVNGSSEHTSIILSKAELQYAPRDECDKAYEKIRSKIRNGINDSIQVCAGKRYETKLCTSETGGTLHILNKEPYCTYNIVGIPSFGSVCGISHRPDVYTRVSSYIGWIEGIVWP